MSKIVTISGTDYTLNLQGDSPAWGDDQSALLEALIEVANNTIGTGDILTTSFTIANNVSSVLDVTSLSFDTSTVRAAIINYSIYRSTTTNEESEAGIMMATYKSSVGTWQLAQTYSGISGIIFTITNAGQIQYVSSNLTGSSYSGKLKFNAKAFVQT